MGSGISILTSDTLEYLLSEGKTVLGVWNKPGCEKCGYDFWDLRYLLFAFKKEEDVGLQFANNTLVLHSCHKHRR